MKEPLTPPARRWQASLALAQSHALSARFPEMLLGCHYTLSLFFKDALQALNDFKSIENK